MEKAMAAATANKEAPTDMALLVTLMVVVMELFWKTAPWAAAAAYSPFKTPRMYLSTLSRNFSKVVPITTK